MNFGYPLKTKISEFLKIPKDRIVYEYDFGDGWEHEIIVQKVIEEIELENLPYCVKGKGKCPPEDCGGIWGYLSLLEIAKKPGSDEYKEYESDYGYDMEEFINTELTKDAINEVNVCFSDFESAVEYQKSIFDEMDISLKSCPKTQIGPQWIMILCNNGCKMAWWRRYEKLAWLD
jgi:hypothetical protein